MKGRAISYSKTELDWIWAMRDTPRAEAHALFVQIFKRPDVTLVNFTALCKRKNWKTGRTGQFRKGERRADNPSRKGYSPPGCEKGWFKKGERRGVATALYKPIGTERVTRDGYIERKVNDDFPLQARWCTVQRINWEAVNGPVPKGHVLKGLDGNKQNVSPENWACVPRGMLSLLNGKSGRDYDHAPAEIRPTIMAAAKLQHRVHELKRGDKKRDTGADHASL